MGIVVIIGVCLCLIELRHLSGQNRVLSRHGQVIAFHRLRTFSADDFVPLIQVRKISVRSPFRKF